MGQIDLVINGYFFSVTSRPANLTYDRRLQRLQVTWTVSPLKRVRKFFTVSGILFSVLHDGQIHLFIIGTSLVSVVTILAIVILNY